ncbi:hypothetical protein PIB30_107773, partial [Stylosanthes scabra]|nr:hypothetical protein [Stylosanthes scabra]
LQSIERRQSNLERGQELIHQEFANHVKDFSARMDQMHTELKAEKDMTTKVKDLVVGLSLDSRANDMYTHWGLQQSPQQQAPPQQAPPEANAPRRENPDSDDE